MSPDTVVGIVDDAADDAAGALDEGAGAAELVAAALGAALDADGVDVALVPLLLLQAATSEPTTSNTPNEVFFTLTISISFRFGRRRPAGTATGD